MDSPPNIPTLGESFLAPQTFASLPVFTQP